MTEIINTPKGFQIIYSRNNTLAKQKGVAGKPMTDKYFETIADAFDWLERY